MSEKNLFTPPLHVNFLAEKLYGNLGEITDVSLAQIGKEGGGPEGNHTHAHDHLFIVTQGEAKIVEDGEVKILKQNEAYLVKGEKPHSVWNNSDGTTVMIGATVIPPKQ
ncbi:MAG: cupin domain-containing protein [Oscillospiraceae bacterium]